jgi:hypothetical protein
VTALLYNTVAKFSESCRMWDLHACSDHKFDHQVRPTIRSERGSSLHMYYEYRRAICQGHRAMTMHKTNKTKHITNLCISDFGENLDSTLANNYGDFEKG